MSTQTGPSMTPKQIDDLRALREGGRITDAFLTSLARHHRRAEADGVRNPARHFAAYFDVLPQTVETWLRMARRRGLTGKDTG